MKNINGVHEGSEGVSSDDSDIKVPKTAPNGKVKIYSPSSNGIASDSDDSSEDEKAAMPAVVKKGNFAVMSKEAKFYLGS